MRYKFKFGWVDPEDKSNGLDGEVVMPPETPEEDAKKMAWTLLKLGNTVELEVSE